MKILAAILLISLIAPGLLAENKSAEQLVASKQKADITYRQLMEMMGNASATIHSGLITGKQAHGGTGRKLYTLSPCTKA